MSDRETVLVRTHRGRAVDIYHTDPDCQALDRASTVRTVPMTRLFADARECRFCSGEYTPSPTPSELVQRLEAAAPSYVGRPVAETRFGG